MNTNKTLKITVSALAFLVLSAGSVYAYSGQQFRRFDELTDEQIVILEEARALREDGDIESAHELIEDAGLDMPRLRGHGFPKKLNEKHEAIRKAIETDDYEAFLDITEDSRMQVEVDEEVFNKMVEAHSLRVGGDIEGAREIMDSLGFERGPKFIDADGDEVGRGMGAGMGMRKMDGSGFDR